MKYLDIKSYKFSTIAKFLNKTFEKNFKILGNIASNFLHLIKFKKLDVRNFYKSFDVSKYIRDIKRILFESLKIFNLKKFIQSVKKISLQNNKFLLLHLPLSIFFFTFLYLSIPTFYNYPKSTIENAICKNSVIKCKINGEVNYRFYPTPRIKIKNLTIRDSKKKGDLEISAKNVIIKLSIKNLLVKEKHRYKKIKFNKFIINLNINNVKKYKNIFKKSNNFLPINLINGKVIFSEGKNYVGTIEKVNLNFKEIKNSIYSILKGKFLNDDIYINLEVKKIDNKFLTNIILKLSKINFLTKANFINSKNDQNITGGNFLIKKDKSKIVGEFDYKNDQLIINKSSVSNAFLNGDLMGKIIFSPYFNFNIDLNLKSLNLKKLYNIFLSSHKKNKENFFTINNKVNGNLNLSSDKMYPNSSLIKSLESRIKFYNGNISIEQLLLNFGKLGAADILGSVERTKKFNNFKFESNVFVDNKRKFLSKFGIYNNKKNIPPNLFISGNFDLKKIRTSFYEISNDSQFSDEDVNYIEKEFNDLMLEDGYKDLFNFLKFKKFIKLVTSEIN